MLNSIDFRIKQLMKSGNLLYFLAPYRFTTYALGIILGYILRNLNDFKLTKKHSMIGDIASWACLSVTIISIASNQTLVQFNQAFYAAFASITFCLFFAWLIVSSRYGHKSKTTFVPINNSHLTTCHLQGIFVTALEWKYFKISTNIAYAFYLVQFIVFFYNVGITRGTSEFSVFSTLVSVI